MDTPHTSPKIGRRTLLKAAGVTAAVAGTAAIVATATQTLRRDTATGAADGYRPPLPLLEVIALNRMGFGARLGDWESFRALGDNDDSRLQAYVDQQLNPQSIADEACDTRLRAARFQTLAKSRAELWRDHTPDNLDWEVRLLPLTETIRATLIKQIYSERQLAEVLADFWHNHFNVYGWEYWPGPVWVHYDRDVIRANLLGNFRVMLEAIATSPAMLYYLNNQTSTDGGPNENFARELFELHTLGVAHYYGVMPRTEVPTDEEGRPLGYCDGDVYEACRCFTGWRVADDEEGSPNDGSFAYREDWHDRFQKVVLGHAFPESQATIALKDGRDVLDLLAQHPGTGRHVARKLCVRLIGDNPPDTIVNSAAQIFTENWQADDQLKLVTRHILLSPEFRTTWGDKVKRPLEHLVSLLRATGAEWRPTSADPWWYNQSGQVMFAWAPPNGYPDHKDAWTGTMSLLQRWRTTNFIMTGETGDDEIDVARPILKLSPAPATATELADMWIEKVLGRPMEDGDFRQEIIDFMADGINPDMPLDLDSDYHAQRLVQMVGLIFLSPDFNYR